MRQLVVQVPRGHGDEVVQRALACGGSHLARLEARGAGEPIDVVFVHVANDRVGPLLDRLEGLPALHVTLTPRGVIPLEPPPERVADQATDVAMRSPIEIYLAGLQSIGSWRGFLGYAAAAGVIVWSGLFTNTVYLLTASMLIAPFAGPAMNAAIATSRGDWHLLRRTLLRYVAALGLTIAVAGALSWILQQEVATPLMVATGQLSVVAVLLPLVAGAAGALHLMQSERSSLVSGAAVGVLVAASLAPPAGLVGMAAALGDWRLVGSGAFTLALQLCGINLSGAIVLRLHGLSSRGVRYPHGRGRVFGAALAASSMGLAALLTLQLWSAPSLQRSSRAQRARAVAQQVVHDDRAVELVDASVRFTRGEAGRDWLVGQILVHRRAGDGAAGEELRTRLAAAIESRWTEQGFHPRALVDVTVLE